MNDFISILKKDIFNIINYLSKKSLLDENLDKSKISIDFLSKSRQGDVSTNLFIILRKFLLNQNFDLNNILKIKINDLKYVKKAFIANAGFINIFFKEEFLIEKLNQVLIDGNNYGKSNIGKKKYVNIEFISANPTGPLHIAHIRGAVYGDVLANILIGTGHKVTKEYYFKD